MNFRPSSTDVAWMVAGAAILALVLGLAWYFHDAADPARQLALKAGRIDLVRSLQVAIASASEAEKSAVLAITDEDSVAFADQARAATAEVERERQELGLLLAEGGTREELDLFARFSEAFGSLQRIDDEVLSLSVRNTNIKAYALTFGPAADTLAEFDASLARVAARLDDSREDRKASGLASGARIGILRIQGLLAPHIAEESDAKMDRLEAAMAAEEAQVGKDLVGLATLTTLAGNADLATAASRFARYRELKVRILALSRENTNVRSLELSLNQKRKAMALCLDALTALQQVLVAEPVRGVTYGRPVHPR